eukprot:160521-Ditylum_brightwellii.AAC.1
MDIANVSPNSFHVRGVNLFKTAKLNALAQQQRLIGKDHTGLANRVKSPYTSDAEAARGTGTEYTCPCR